MYHAELINALNNLISPLKYPQMTSLNRLLIIYVFRVAVLPYKMTSITLKIQEWLQNMILWADKTFNYFIYFTAIHPGKSHWDRSFFFFLRMAWAWRYSTYFELLGK